jgi:hypothetical protein
MSTSTIHDLRRAGYKVYVDHYRYFIEDVTCDYIFTDKIRKRTKTHKIPVLKKYSMSTITKDRKKDVFARGGETVVTITTNAGTFSSNVHCSIDDNYNKKEGASQALTKLLAAIKLS